MDNMDNIDAATKAIVEAINDGSLQEFSASEATAIRRDSGLDVNDPAERVGMARITLVSGRRVVVRSPRALASGVITFYVIDPGPEPSMIVQTQHIVSIEHTSQE